LALIGKNREKFGVSSDGSIMTYKNQPIGDSNFIDSLKFMTGQIPTPPRGYQFFRTKFLKDETIKSQFLQRGEGKINKKLIVVKIKPIRSKGIKRVKNFNFKPTLWAKL
jgi:hypothetical protein